MHNAKTTPTYIRKCLVFEKIKAVYYCLCYLIPRMLIDTECCSQTEKNALYCSLPKQSFVNYCTVIIIVGNGR